MSNSGEPQTCSCGFIAEKVILYAPQVFISKDVHYRSPIDDRPITSAQARLEDMARNGCQEYDPGMRVDYDRRQKTSEAALEKSFDDLVDREVATMSADKLGRLANEVSGGMTAEPIRITPNVKPLQVELNRS